MQGLSLQSLGVRLGELKGAGGKPACDLALVCGGPSTARGWKSIQVKGVPFFMGVPLQGVPQSPLAACIQPNVLPCRGLEWDLGALPKTDPHPSSLSWAAAPWPRKHPEEMCLDMCRVY